MLSTEPGIHGSFAWSCAVECADDPNTDCGTVFVAGSSLEGSHAYGTCVLDILDNPEMYEDERLTVHGTHMLAAEEIEEIYGHDRGAPPADIDLTTVTDVWRRDSSEGDDTRLVAIAVDYRDNNISIISAAILLDLLKHPDAFDGEYTLYGTHLLSEADILHHFPDPDER